MPAPAAILPDLVKPGNYLYVSKTNEPGLLIMQCNICAQIKTGVRYKFATINRYFLNNN